MKGKIATEKDQHTFLFDKHIKGRKKISTMQVINSRFRYVSNRLPVTPSIVSSIGSMWTRFPYST